jgi:hypothetical protein
VLADIVPSYFDRTWEHFCSHRHTPSAGKPWQSCNRAQRQRHLLQQPDLHDLSEGGAAVVQAAAAQRARLAAARAAGASRRAIYAARHAQRAAAQQRQVLHLLHYIPERRGEFFDVIEDVIPLYDVKLSVRVPKPVKRIASAPQGEALPFTIAGDRVEFVVPSIRGHQMIEMSFA